MTNSNELYHKDCDKIDALCVDAYFDLSLNPENPSELIFDNSWGTWNLDLTPAVKAAETMTYLDLYPASNPVYLRYVGEDGLDQCIHGDDLSRIISMIYLKDVDQGTRPIDGDVYMYNGDDSKFYTYNLKAFINTTNNSLTSLENRMTAAESAITQLSALIAALTNRVSYLEEITRKPEGAPDNTHIVWGNINDLSDYTNSDNRNWGLYSHNPANLIPNDQYFS